MVHFWYRLVGFSLVAVLPIVIISVCSKFYPELDQGEVLVMTFVIWVHSFLLFGIGDALLQDKEDLT